MSRKTLLILGCTILIFIATFGAYYFFMRESSTPVGGQPALATQTITIGSTSIIAEVAITEEERQQGLSGRLSLTEGRGLLFVFPKDGNWGIWMKDMQFPIDILWADKSGKILALNASISPETYPNVFYPNNNTRYVLELPAGYAAVYKIEVGNTIGSLPR